MHFRAKGSKNPFTLTLRVVEALFSLNGSRLWFRAVWSIVVPKYGYKGASAKQINVSRSDLNGNWRWYWTCFRYCSTGSRLFDVHHTVADKIQKNGDDANVMMTIPKSQNNAMMARVDLSHLCGTQSSGSQSWFISSFHRNVTYWQQACLEGAKTAFCLDYGNDSDQDIQAGAPGDALLGRFKLWAQLDTFQNNVASSILFSPFSIRPVAGFIRSLVN